MNADQRPGLFWEVELWEQVMEIERARCMLLPDTFQIDVVRTSHQTWTCRAVPSIHNAGTGMCDVPTSTERTVEAAIARFLLSADRYMRNNERMVPRFPSAGPWPEGGSFRPAPNTEEGRAWNEAAAKDRASHSPSLRYPIEGKAEPVGEPCDGPRKKLPVTESNPD